MKKKQSLKVYLEKWNLGGLRTRIWEIDLECSFWREKGWEAECYRFPIILPISRFGIIWGFRVSVSRYGLLRRDALMNKYLIIREYTKNHMQMT